MTVDVSTLIAQIERQDLEGAASTPFDGAAIDGLPFIRIRGLSAFWRVDGTENGTGRARDIAIGAHEHEAWLALALSGSPERLDVQMAIGDEGTTSRLVQSAYPGVRIEKGSLTLGSDLAKLFAHGGRLTGVPSGRGGGDTAHRSADDGYLLTRVVRGMRAASWAVVVRAWPLNAEQVRAERATIASRLSEVVPLMKRDLSRTVQHTRARTDHVSEGVSDVLGGVVIDRQAEYLVSLLEREMERLDEGRAVGRWQVAIHYGATEEQVARELGGLLRGVFSGPESTPEPIRALPTRMRPRRGGGSGTAVVASGSSPVGGVDADYFTALSSSELGLILELPREEFPGFQVSDYVPFDVDFISPRRGKTIVIGDILRSGTPSGSRFALAIDDLAKHALVAGVTGSGKTTTISSILLQMARARLPFLVIEPAKTEYRALLPQPRVGSPGLLGDVRVYTLGNDRVAPFRLNPFEFDTAEDSSISLLLSHIDLLKAVFNAAFVLYAPMPYVLDMALHEIYEDKGWNLATGVNVRLSREHWVRRDEFCIFPTLGDLYHKVATVTRRLGYDSKIEQDVSAGLQARVGSLRVGSKGLMLDVPRGVPTSELFGYSTILELESIGNDTEKAFVIGMVFARLYEYRRVQAATGKLPEGLQHLLVVEEAHRLLRRTSVDVDSESSNMRAQAVETFANLLSEVRRYGQGVLLAEQIPGKLAADAIKNTNLKVMHRIVAADDRATLAGATNMSDSQSAQLATLLPGQAVVFAEGADRPYLVATKDVLGGNRQTAPTDRELQDYAGGYVSLGRSLPVGDLASFGIGGPAAGEPPEPMLSQRVLQFLSETGSAMWSRIVLRTIHSRGQLPAELANLERLFIVSSPQIAPARKASALRLLIALGADAAMQSRAAERMWGFVAADGLRVSLTRGLLESLSGGRADVATRHLDSFARGYEAATGHEHGPFPGCVDCPNPCLFRSEVRRLASSDLATTILRRYTDTTTKTTLKRSMDASAEIQKATGQWLGGKPKRSGGLEYCVAVTSASTAGLDVYQQAELARHLTPHLL